MKSFEELKYLIEGNVPWKQQIAKMSARDWGLYSETGDKEAAKDMNKELTGLVSKAFKQLGTDGTIEQSAISVFRDFEKGALKKYHKLGSEDTAVTDKVATLLGIIFMINPNKF